MNSTAVPTQNQAGEYRRSRSTGRAYRVNNDDLIPKHKRYLLPARFHRESLWDWIVRQTDQAAQLNTPGSKAARLVRHYGTRGLVLYTLSARELGVTDPKRIAWLEAPENYDRLETIEAWGRLLGAAFPEQPFKSALHCGRENRVAPHVVAGALHNIPNPSRDPERIKPVKDTFRDRQRVFAYLCSKQYLTYRQVRAFDRAVAAAGSVRNLPQHAGYSNMGFVSTVENAVTDTTYRKVPKVIGFDESLPQTTRLGRLIIDLFTASRVAVTTLDKPPGKEVAMT